MKLPILYTLTEFKNAVEVLRIHEKRQNPAFRNLVRSIKSFSMLRKSSFTKMSASSSSSLIPFAQPFEMFDKWLNEAKEAKGEAWPNAINLATCTKDGFPSNRIVLMQRHEVGRIAWYTNYTSRKANELDENPRAAALFYWNKLQRQVRFEGRVEKGTPEESDAYFMSRPRESRIASIASKQSKELVGGRDQLLKDIDETRKKYQNVVQDEKQEQEQHADAENKNTNKIIYEEKEVTRPDHMGLYWLYPTRIEFWEEGEYRVHSRNVYELVVGEGEEKEKSKGWKHCMLYP